MAERSTTPPEFVPSVSEYVVAFKKIEDKMNGKQRELLRNHHDSPSRVTTATELGHSVGFADYHGTNSQYGRLGTLLAEAMGIEHWTLSMFVTFIAPGEVTNKHWLLVMRENVALALEELGWAPKTSNLFFPQGYDTNATPPEEAK
jgi:hypothetical protein